MPDSDMESTSNNYLVNAYKLTSQNWYEFKKSQNPTDLKRAATALCDGYARLCEDRDFWLALHSMQSGVEKNRNEVQQIIMQLDTLLMLERDILRGFLPPVESERLITDMASAVNWINENDWPTGYAIENLRNKSLQIRDAICDAVEDVPNEITQGNSRQFFRAVRIVGHGVVLIGGAACIIANLTAAGIALYISLGSAVTGFKVMVDQVKELEPLVVPK